MTVHLTTEQERRIQAIIHTGADAAIAAVEQRSVPGFDGAEAELEALLLAGIDSPEMPEEQFWSSVDRATDAMLAEQQARVHP